MKCDEICALLDLHMDKQLPTESATKLDRHLLRCQSCAHELHTLQQTRAMLREAVAPSETTANFRARTLARLVDNFAPNSRRVAVNSRQWTLPFRDEKQQE